VVSTEPAREAAKHPLDETVLREQLGRLGQTPFELRQLTATISGRPMLPFSLLGRLRHDLAAALDAAVSAAIESDLRPAALLDPPEREPSTPAGDRLHVLVRSLAQLSAVLDLGEGSIYADFADIRLYRETVAACRGVGATILLATPRIQKPGELGIFGLLAKQEPDGVLARNWAAVQFFREHGLPVIGDYSLNVANRITARHFLAAGCGRVTASYDLAREQLLALVAAMPAAQLEVVIHQHMPMFHMEHCVFCAVLSPGTNKTNCGRPCDEHVVQLRDRIGMEHPLTADVGCRNTLFNAVPQSGAEAVAALRSAGVRQFRIEFLTEGEAEIGQVVRAYRDLLAGTTSGRDVWQMLKAANRVGVTRGTLEERRDPLAIL
jgi:putative protease